MPVGKSFFDQYSVICVLGSVVGCVVVPLITQSMESLILSAILISITAKTLSSKIAASSNDPREDRRRPRDKDPLVEKKVKRKKLLAVQSEPSSQLALDPDEPQREQQEDELRKQDEQRADKERRAEEKREKKARKREDRLKRKEEERKEKEKEEQIRKEKGDVRVSRKSESRALSPPSDQLAGIPSHKPTHHERHSSTSSTTSNSSTHTSSRHKCHSYKQLSTESPPHIPPLMQSPPSTHTKGWQPLPPTQGPLMWQPDIPPRHLERLQRVRDDKPPRFKQSQQTLVTSSILHQHKEAAMQQLPSPIVPSVDKPVEPTVAQVGLGSQTVLNCSHGAPGQPPNVQLTPAPSCNNDIWASTQIGYYSLFSTSGHTLFGNSFLPPSCDRAEEWPDV